MKDANSLSEFILITGINFEYNGTHGMYDVSLTGEDRHNNPIRFSSRASRGQLGQFLEVLKEKFV